MDTDTLRLTRHGDDVPVEPQVFDLLVQLAINAGKVVSKDALIETVWQGRIVSDATISARINAARTAVGDDGTLQAIIRTIPRRGFELRVNVTSISDDLGAPAATPTQFRQRIKYATSVDGTRIAYSVAGSGPPVLRLAHHLSHLEMDWNSPFWRPQFDRFAEHNSLIRYDVRGTGLSDANLDGAGLAEYVADLAAVVDAANIDNFPLVANLQCAPVAIRYIADNPGRVSRLVIQEGYVRGRALRSGAPSSSDADPVISLIQNGWGDPNNGFMRAWVSMIIPNASHEEVTGMIELISSVTSTEFVVAARRVIDKFNVEDCLDRITIPTLVIHANGDTIHPVAEARELAMGIPDAELMVVQSSHTLCIPSDPTWAEQIDAIVEFVSER